MILNKEQQEQLITDFAYAANRYLKEVGCVREADNVDPVWARTEDICEAIGASQTIWYSVRQKMIELGFPLALQYFGGYYLGKDGEQSTLLLHKKAMIKGLANSFNDDIISLAKSGTLEDVRKMAEVRFNIPLNDIPKMLRALGNPLPAQIEMLLIEANT